VLVAATTGALLEGSDLSLEDAGSDDLKGLPGPLQVFRLVS
jgi:class 3 adenylate cyclase